MAIVPLYSPFRKREHYRGEERKITNGRFIGERKGRGQNTQFGRNQMFAENNEEPQSPLCDGQGEKTFFSPPRRENAGGLDTRTGP